MQTSKLTVPTQNVSIRPISRSVFNTTQPNVEALTAKTNAIKDEINKADELKTLVKQLQKSYKKEIQKIKNNNKTDLKLSRREIEQNDVKIANQMPRTGRTTSFYKPNTDTKNQTFKGVDTTRASKQFAQKNKMVDDMNRMTFDRKFKNFIDHKQEILQKTKAQYERKKNKKIKPQEQEEIIRQDDIVSNNDPDFRYKNAEEMRIAYKEMYGGKGLRKKISLQHAQKFQHEFRKKEFNQLLRIQKSQDQLISKELLINYLFNEIQIMMLYSINPYGIGDQIAEYDTQIPDRLNFQEFSKYLLIDRQPTFFKYTKEVIQEARKIGKGIKCAPIIAKWIDQNGIYQLMLGVFKQVDMFGNNKAERGVLVSKIKKQALQRNFLDLDVIQIVNIPKKIPLSRLLYEIEYEDPGKVQWTFDEFKNFLDHYHRLRTGEKDKNIQKQILAGKYDVSYIFIISLSIVSIVKEAFHQLQKFAQHFVLKSAFIQRLTKHPEYNKYKHVKVRKQKFRDLPIETIQQTVARINIEAEQYCDIQEIIQFFTNRGRPRCVEYQVYQKQLELKMKQIQQEQAQKSGTDGTTETDDQDEEEYGKIVKQRKVKRFLDKIAKKKLESKIDPNKVYNVTIPLPFQMTQREQNKKLSIREKKLMQMLKEKQEKLEEELKPIPSREVPQYVKENLYQKFKLKQDRARKQRLDQFRAQIAQLMVPMPDRLVKPKQLDIHCPIQRDSYQFVARPLPWYCQVQLLERINKEKQERRQKILQQVIQRQTNYDLPEGVLNMLKRNDQLKKKRQGKSKKRSDSLPQFTFVPHTGAPIPNFPAIHENLKMQLQEAKKSFQPTTGEPFSFQNRKSRRRKVKSEQKIEVACHSTKKVTFKESVQKPATTLKYQALVNLRQKQTLQKQREQQKIEYDEKKRKIRKQKFAPFVQEALKKTSASRVHRNRLQELQRQEQQKKHQYEQQMLKIYTKVLNRPLLIQNSGLYGQNQVNRIARLNYEQSPHFKRNQQNRIPPNIKPQPKKQVKPKKVPAASSNKPLNKQDFAQKQIQKNMLGEKMEKKANQQKQEQQQYSQQYANQMQQFLFRENQEKAREYQRLRNQIQNRQDQYSEQQDEPSEMQRNSI